MAHDDRTGVGYLVVEELAEILHIHFAFARVHNRGKGVQHDLVAADALHGLDHVRKFTDARGLDQNAIRMELGKYLLQRLAEIAHKAAADAAGIHFGDLNTCVLQKAAVDADLAEFIFDQNQFFALIAVLDQLFDQRGLAGAQKT